LLLIAFLLGILYIAFTHNTGHSSQLDEKQNQFGKGVRPGAALAAVGAVISGAPGSTTCNISPGQVTLNGVNTAQATVTVTVGKHSTVGTYTLALKGTSGSITHSTTVTLTIN
jgi:hypothetical protein